MYRSLATAVCKPSNQSLVLALAVEEGTKNPRRMSCCAAKPKAGARRPPPPAVFPVSPARTPAPAPSPTPAPAPAPVAVSAPKHEEQPLTVLPQETAAAEKAAGREEVLEFLNEVGDEELTDSVITSFIEAKFAPTQWRAELESMKAEEGEFAKFLELVKKNSAAVESAAEANGVANGVANGNVSEEAADEDTAGEEEEEEEEEAEDSEEEDEGDMLGEYRILKSVNLFKGAAVNSQRKGKLDEGEIVDVKEIENIDGKVRLRCASGWFTMNHRRVEKLSHEDMGPMAPKNSEGTVSTTISRRGSVAVDGIGAVQQSASLAAIQLGKLAEQVFEVTQSHLPKASERIQIKIGGMGVSLYDGPTPLASYIYQVRARAFVDFMCTFVSVGLQCLPTSGGPSICDIKLTSCAVLLRVHSAWRNGPYPRNGKNSLSVWLRTPPPSFRTSRSVAKAVSVRWGS